jgi:hypothetical protein
MLPVNHGDGVWRPFIELIEVPFDELRVRGAS